MARNRTIYSNEILMVSPSATGYQFLNGDKSAAGESLLRQLKRIQNINYGYGISRTPTYQFGTLARISTVVLEAPSVSLDFTYYLTDGKNEQLLGFNTNDATNFLKPQIQSDADGRNFYIYTTKEGHDAIGSIDSVEAVDSSEKSIVSLGNCYVTNYSASASVGAIPVANVGIEGFNIRSENGRGMTGRSPGINVTDGVSSDSLGRTFEIQPEYITTGEGVAELMPGDIEVSLGDASLLSLLTDTEDNTAAHIQNFSIDIPMSRTTLQRVGNSFGFSKSIDLPITASVSISAILADRPGSSKSLFSEIYEDNKNDLTIKLKKPSSLGAKKGDDGMIFSVRNAVLEGESYGMSIGDNRSVDFSFSATIGEAGEISKLGGSSYVDVNASGVYEKWQVFTTGMSTDIPQQRGEVSRLKRDTCGYGTAIGVNENYLAIGASGFSPDNSQRGCVYIYKNNKGMYTQMQVLSGSVTDIGVHSADRGVGDIDLGGITNASAMLTGGSAADSNFGAACAISSGDMLAIGMPNHAASGAVVIYEPNASDTRFLVNSALTGDRANSRFGDAVAFDKDVSGDGKQFFVVGAPRGEMGLSHETSVSGDRGNVIVGYAQQGLVNSATTAALSTASSVITGEQILVNNSRVGSSVAMHRGVVVAGAPGSSPGSGFATTTEVTHSGQALVWVATEGDGTTNTDWILYASLSGTAENATHPGFGCDVDIYNNTIVVGAPSGTHGGNAEAGAVYMFTGCNDVGGTDTEAAHNKPKRWAYATTLVADDAAGDDQFGFSVAMPNQNTVIVGAPGTDPTRDGITSTEVGSAYIFTGRNDAINGVCDWSQTQRVEWTGVSSSEEAGKPESALAATQKEIFLGENNNLHTTTSDNDIEKVIRYRL